MRGGSVTTQQILRGVRGEAVALDRFLALEVEPAAQQIFDGATLEHARACSLLTGQPVAAFGIDPVSSNSSTPCAATNTNDDDDDDDTNDISGGTAAAASAEVPTAGILSDARRRAMKAQVIKVQPPQEFSFRASLPARGVARADAAFGRPPSAAFARHDNAAGAGAVAAGSSDNSRWSLPGRHYRITKTAEKAGRRALDGPVRWTAVAPRGTGTLAGAATGNGRAGDGAATSRRGGGGADDASETSYANNEEGQEGDEDNGEWEMPLPAGQVSRPLMSRGFGIWRASISFLWIPHLKIYKRTAMSCLSDVPGIVLGDSHLPVRIRKLHTPLLVPGY